MWAWIGSAIASLLSAGVVRYIAIKTILTVLIITILPIVLNNVIYKVMDEVFQVVAGQGQDLHSFVAQFSGMTGWFFNQLSIPEGISIFLSAVAIKYTLGLIPFIRA